MLLYCFICTSIMTKPGQYRDKIENALREISFNSAPETLYEPVRYMLSLGGKRMRPLLVLMGCDLFDGNADDAVAAACGIEVFHNFTLLHDDIMDKAPLRRNKPTVHTKWNPDIAILSGDAMFVKSVQLMMQVDEKILRPVLDLFNATAIQVCEGQQMDMDFEKSSDISVVEYLEMISLKTSVLLACSLKTGALIAGANKEDANYLYEFGKNIGIAFQVQDDLLDTYGDKEKFGKQMGGDILANKKTLLYLKALELANDETKKFLEAIYAGKTNLQGSEKIEKVKAVFDSLEIKKHISKTIADYHTEALKHFEAINVPSEKKKTLLDFCEKLMIREL